MTVEIQQEVTSISVRDEFGDVLAFDVLENHNVLEAEVSIGSCVHLTPDDARTLAKALIAWADGESA